MLSFRSLNCGAATAALRSFSKVGGRDVSSMSRGPLLLNQTVGRYVLGKSSNSPQTLQQLRTSIFSRGKVVGDRGLQASSVAVGRSSSTTFSKIAFYVKVVRIPFLIVAIYGLGYRQGITDTVRNPLKLQQVSYSMIIICLFQNIIGMRLFPGCNLSNVRAIPTQSLVGYF